MSMSERPLCTPDELAASVNSSTLHCFTRGESLGLLLTTVASVVSLIAVCYVFFVILWNFGQFYLNPEKRRQGLRSFHQPIDLLLLSLFVADALQATGGALDAKWVNDGKVEVGTLCNVQGIIQNVGETAVAIFNLTITIYTFLGLWLRSNISSIRLALGVITCIWLFIAIIVAVGNTIHHNPAYESPTPYRCWISDDYMAWRIVAEYMWLWIALLFSLIVYVPLLWLLRDNPHARGRQALIFLAYPLTYCISVLPMSVIRWIGFVQQAKNNTTSIPVAAAFATFTLFSLSGFFNVVLLLSTRPKAGIFGSLVPPQLPPEPTLSNSQADEKEGKIQTVERKMESLSDGSGMLP